MAKIKLKIQDYIDRRDMVGILARAGYAVWEEKKKKTIIEKDYYICFDDEKI